MENSMEDPKKVKYSTSVFSLAILLLGIHSKEMKTLKNKTKQNKTKMIAALLCSQHYS